MVKDMKVEKKDPRSAVVYLGERVNIMNSPRLKVILQKLCDEGVLSISVDFTGTVMVDSSCLGKLLMYHKVLKEAGGELRIINVGSEHIKRMFKTIHFHKIIKIL